MEITELFKKPVADLTVEEQKTMLDFMKGMYQDLLEVVGGRSTREKEQAILDLSFDQKVSLVEEYRRERE